MGQNIFFYIFPNIIVIIFSIYIYIDQIVFCIYRSSIFCISIHRILSI